MTAKDFLTGQIDVGNKLIEAFLNGFTDEEFLFALPEGGQTVIWILGHLAVTEDWALSKLTGSEYQIAEDLHAKYKGGSTVSIDPGENLSRQEAEALFREQRARSLEALAAADESLWDDAAPEGLPAFFPTIGAAWGLLASHQMWHFGQLSVIRRSLKKPSAFGG